MQQNSSIKGKLSLTQITTWNTQILESYISSIQGAIKSIVNEICNLIGKKTKN